MKKILAILVFVLIGTMSYAQWLGTSPGTLYTTLPTGNVGIGTTAPLWTLDVVNPTNFSAIIAQSPYTAAGNRAVGIFRMTNTATGDFYNISLRKNGGVFQCVQNANVAGFGAVDISVFSYATRSLETRAGVTDITYLNSGNFLIRNTGAVGIGTTAAIPAGIKLAVNGKVNCKEVEVTLAGWSDFVFNSDYKLRSLYDVENFIAVNKHLPDVPSEREVLENGVNLGDMNSILLQKIEELTLYMIDLKKENDVLKARVSKLEK
jgi:hypothetical protein